MAVRLAPDSVLRSTVQPIGLRELHDQVDQRLDIRDIVELGVCHFSLQSKGGVFAVAGSIHVRHQQVVHAIHGHDLLCRGAKGRCVEDAIEAAEELPTLWHVADLPTSVGVARHPANADELATLQPTLTVKAVPEVLLTDAT